jgi:V-type H+-transporting ATPase subunit C
MSSGGRYHLVSLPASIDRDHDREAAFTKIRDVIPAGAGTIAAFPIPEFKIGTLDALVLQADELAKLEANVEGAIHKVVDVLRNIVPGQEAQHKLVNESACSRGGVGGVRGRWLMAAEPVDRYLENFQWNKVKYRADKSIGENMDALQRVPPLPSP